MSRAGFVCPVLLCAVLARGDTVEMKPESPDPDAPGLKLEGKVERVLDDAIIFLVYNETGHIRIPKHKIKNIEYDVNTQWDKVAEDDFAGKYKVGVWAVEKGKFAEAIKIFEELKGQEGPGKDMLKLLGHAYEQRQQLDKAFENYSDYIKLFPDDQEAVEKVGKLRQVVNPEPAAAPGEDGKTAPVKKIVDGLEGDGVWIIENWGNPGTVQLTADPNSGGKVAAVQCQGGQKDKTAISRTGQPLNLSDSKEMIFKVTHNCATPVNLAVAFINSQGEFHETEQKRVPANTWVPVTQKIDGRNYKANRNNFKTYDQELEGRERINRILFLVYTQKPFTLYLESVFFK